MSSIPNTNQIDVIKNFITKNQGIQRANRYEVTFNIPNINSVGDDFVGPNNTNLILYPAAISFGARAVNYVYDNLQGYNYGRAVPNSSKYVGGIVFTFLVTGNLNVMNLFYSWMDLLYKKNNNYFTTSYYNDVVKYSWAKIKFLDLNGNATAFNSTWTFKEAYPVECMPIELSAKTDTPLLFQVVLNYREIERSTEINA